MKILFLLLAVFFGPADARCVNKILTLDDGGFFLDGGSSILTGKAKCGGYKILWESPLGQERPRLLFNGVEVKAGSTQEHLLVKDLQKLISKHKTTPGCVPERCKIDPDSGSVPFLVATALVENICGRYWYGECGTNKVNNTQ